MALNEFQRAAYKAFGGVAAKTGSLSKLGEELRKARMPIRPEAYLASTIAFSLLSGLIGFLLGGFAVFVVVPKAMPGAPPVLAVLAPAIGLLMAVTTYATMVATPASKAKARTKDIEEKIPYALNYIAAMASAGVNIDLVFRSLGEQKIYSECSTEAAAIYRDMAYFGRDSVTAMRRGIERTPSDKWAEFLQGAITTVTSGGDLQFYLSSKAQRYMWENRQNQKQFVDMMGLMAETYVTACVAGPLFLIVMMSIMGMLGGEGPAQMYLIVYMLLPVANLGFTYALAAMTPEV